MSSLFTLRALQDMTDRKSDIGDIARALFEGSRPPVALAMDAAMYQWSNEIAHCAPPRVKFAMLTQMSPPAPIFFLELPERDCGRGIFVEVRGNVVRATHVECDDTDVYVGALRGVFHLPPVRAPFDWQEADAPAWIVDPEVDPIWQAFGDHYMRAEVLPGADRPDQDVVDGTFRRVLIPDMCALAAVFSPHVRHTDALSNPDGSVRVLEHLGHG